MVIIYRALPIRSRYGPFGRLAAPDSRQLLCASLGRCGVRSRTVPMA